MVANHYIVLNYFMITTTLYDTIFQAAKKRSLYYKQYVVLVKRYLHLQCFLTLIVSNSWMQLLWIYYIICEHMHVHTYVYKLKPKLFRILSGMCWSQFRNSVRARRRNRHRFHISFMPALHTSIWLLLLLVYFLCDSAWSVHRSVTEVGNIGWWRYRVVCMRGYAA